MNVAEVVYRARAYDTPEDPFTTGAGFRYGDDLGLVVSDDGVIVDRGPYADVVAIRPGSPVLDLRDGILLPGLVDTHVHFPQVRVIGALGMPLLEWLDRCALPEEQHLASPDYAATIAYEFVAEPDRRGHHHVAGVRVALRPGRRPALRGGRALRAASHERARRQRPDAARAAAHHPGAGVRRGARPRAALARARKAALRRHAALLVLRVRPGAGRLRRGAGRGRRRVLHLARQREPGRGGHGRRPVPRPGPLRRHVRPPRPARSAARCWPTTCIPPTPSSAVLAARASAVAYCPTSNSALGSGLFPLRRHLEAGVRVALGSDVGAGTGFSIFKEGLQAYFLQHLLGADGMPLTAAHLLHLSTSAGAAALGLADTVGDLSVGKQFDAVLVRPAGRHRPRHRHAARGHAGGCARQGLRPRRRRRRRRGVGRRGPDRVGWLRAARQSPRASRTSYARRVRKSG